MRRAGVTSDWLMRHRGVIDIEVLQLDPIASSAGRYDQVVDAGEADLICMFLPMVLNRGNVQRKIVEALECGEEGVARYLRAKYARHASHNFMRTALSPKPASCSRLFDNKLLPTLA